MATAHVSLVVEAESRVHRAREALRYAIEAAPCVQVAKSTLARLAPGAPPRCRVEAAELVDEARRTAFDSDGVVAVHRKRLAAALREVEDAQDRWGGEERPSGHYEVDS